MLLVNSSVNGAVDFCQTLRVRGDERRIVEAFCSWLVGEGWTVRREVDFVDVAAERGDERLYAEAKGRTLAPSTDIDTLSGQLLRRMPPMRSEKRGILTAMSIVRRQHGRAGNRHI